MSKLADGLAKAIGNEQGVLAAPFPGVAGLNYEDGAGGNVFVGFLPARPNRVASVIPTGGYEADTKLPYDEVTCQIVIRGDEDPRWALDMWDAVYDVVQGITATTLPNGLYVVSLFAQQSGPVHMGKDDSGRVQYSMNLLSEILNPTNRRPGPA